MNGVLPDYNRRNNLNLPRKGNDMTTEVLNCEKNPIVLYHEALNHNARMDATDDELEWSQGVIDAYFGMKEIGSNRHYLAGHRQTTLAKGDK